MNEWISEWMDLWVSDWVEGAACCCTLQVAMKHPAAVTACNVDLENLITDSNRSIATLAITTLLKVRSCPCHAGRLEQRSCLSCLGTNLIHDFMAVTFSVKLAFFLEKRRFPWNPWFFVNFSAFCLIYDSSRVLSAAFVRMLLFAMCPTSALSSWRWLSWVLT